MTYEELKLEADKLGYKLIKKTEPIKRLPCTCGCKLVWYSCSAFDVGFKCRICGKRSSSKIGASERQKIIDWNNMIKGEEK